MYWCCKAKVASNTCQDQTTLIQPGFEAILSWLTDFQHQAILLKMFKHCQQ